MNQRFNRKKMNQNNKQNKTAEQTKSACLGLLRKYCESRDESHGEQHATRVLLTSLDIVKHEYLLSDKELNILHAVAILHDFADHKYEKGITMTKLLQEFLFSYFDGKDAQLILDIIDRISFSKEVKFGSSKWEQDLGSRGLLIRNIVSDADKIDATGVVGLERCKTYTMHVNPKFTIKQLIVAVKKHIDEKLGIIDTYCRTKYGKAMAKKKIAELDQEFNKWKSQNE